MFTGIIEATGVVKEIEQDGTNIHFTFESPISNELKIDQSLAHDGVCLTTVRIDGNTHTVTAVEETMKRSNMERLEVGSLVNLERAMKSDGRLDGHIVQGHVDATAKCVKIEVLEGSWYFTFQYQSSPEHLLVDKGSICINGVSMTVVSPTLEQFSIAVIPYTFEHTNFKTMQIDTVINLEFDVIGKYISKYLAVYGLEMPEK